MLVCCMQHLQLLFISLFLALNVALAPTTKVFDTTMTAKERANVTIVTSRIKMALKTEFFSRITPRNFVNYYYGSWVFVAHNSKLKGHGFESW